MIEWWHKPQRIVQTNLRLPDASLDPEKLAADVAEFGATAMLFNVGGIFAWYPTQLPLQPMNPYLDHDLLDRMVKAAHARNIKLIGRYDLSKGTRIAYDAHPEWFCCDAAGDPHEYNGTYQACVNGGWYHHQGMEVLRETLPKYAIDGLFFNMFGYLSVDYSLRSYGLCHCPNCQRAFADFADAELPRERDLSDALYRRYLQFQDVTSARLAGEIHDLIKQLRPDVGVSNMGKRSDFFRGEVNRRLDRAQPEWVHFSGEQARNFRSLGANKIRHSAALTHFIDFPWRYSAETGACQANRLAQQLANGADPHYYFMGLLDQADRKALPDVRAVFAHHERHQELYANLESAARIGLYASHKSRRYFPEAGAAQTAFRGAYRALLDAGLPFDLINDGRAIEDDFAALHKHYDTIVLAGAGCLSNIEASALDAYVAAGGTLLVLGSPAVHDETGALLDSPRLDSLPVSGEWRKHESMRGGYVQTHATGIDGLDSDLVLLDGPYYEVAPADGAQQDFTILMPQRFGPPELCFAEPELHTNLPGVITGNHGHGNCIYVPWEVGTLYEVHCLPEHGRLIAELASRYAGKQPAAISPCDRTEITVQREQESGNLVVHVINYSGHNANAFSNPVPMHDLELTLPGTSYGNCRALIAEKDLVLQPTPDGDSKIKLPPVGHFEVISIEVA